MTHTPYAFALRSVAGDPYTIRTLTLEEALAYVRLFVEGGEGNWSDYEIRHDDGRRWYWEMQGRHGVIKVDNPPKAD